MNDLRLSRVIDGMRLPLIYLVVVAHLVPFTYKEVIWPSTSNELYTLISEMISHHIARIPVRCYFFVSGYYFFLRYTDNIIQFGTFQYKSRFKTLFIPFVAWNAMVILGVLLKNLLFVNVGLHTDVEFQFVSETSIFQLFWIGPVNFPLWYIRDLMCMIMLFPIILYFIKICKHYGIILLGVLYVAAIEPEIPGFSMTAIFFFSAGAYFSIYKRDVLVFFEKFKVISSY